MKKYIILAVVLFFNALTSCNFEKEDEAEITRVQNEKEIQAYLATNNLTAQKTASGLYYIITPVGTVIDRKIATGDEVAVKFTTKSLSGILIDFSKTGEPTKYVVGVSSIINGYGEALSLLRPGEKGLFLIPSSLGFGNTLIEGNAGRSLPPNSVLLYESEIVSIMNEDEQIQAYTTKKAIFPERKTSGLYYLKTKAGTGAQAVKDKKVTLSYKGTLLDGTSFDSSTSFSFTIGLEVASNKIIKGFDEAVSLMQQGEKATFILPSSLAYGAAGAGSSSIIKGYTPIVFEIELTKVE